MFFEGIFDDIIQPFDQITFKVELNESTEAARKVGDIK